MTLGDKIKKYRSLNGWSQKELGQKVGFSDSTADSRIRKYENDIIAPKSELREKLADTLNVNISALSDINIDTLEDVMQALFLFEEKFGMTIERSEGKTILTFDEPTQRFQVPMYYPLTSMHGMFKRNQLQLKILTHIQNTKNGKVVSLMTFMIIGIYN